MAHGNVGRKAKGSKSNGVAHGIGGREGRGSKVLIFKLRLGASIPRSVGLSVGRSSKKKLQ